MHHSSASYVARECGKCNLKSYYLYTRNYFGKKTSESLNTSWTGAAKYLQYYNVCCNFINYKLCYYRSWLCHKLFDNQEKLYNLQMLNITIKNYFSLSREPRKRRPTRCRFPCRVDSAGPVSPTCN